MKWVIKDLAMSYGLQSLTKFNNRREHEVIFTSLEGYFVSSVKISFIRTSFAGRKELGKSSGLKTKKKIMLLTF